MNWQDLLKPEISKFITDHEHEDPKALALKKAPDPSWPMPLILDQIKARQKVAKKMPHWLDIPNMVMPPAPLVEQGSSYPCAKYKCDLMEGEYFADLTAGCGFDSALLAHNFAKGICVEKDRTNAEILSHNFMVSGEDHVLVKHADALSYVATMPEVDVIYLDPQRRDSAKRGLYTLQECGPNVIEMLPWLQKKCQSLFVKTSPVLDISRAIETLGYVHAVHIVEYDGECKEVLYHLQFDTKAESVQIPIIAVQINDQGQVKNDLTFTLAQEKASIPNISAPQKYLYEPAPAFLKAGAFGLLAERFALFKIATNTHLYTSDKAISDFPGRCFEILKTLPINAKALKAVLPEMKANLKTRNFPMKTEDLRKKLKLKDGGDTYLYAFQNDRGKKMMLQCLKYGKI